MSNGKEKPEKAVTKKTETPTTPDTPEIADLISQIPPEHRDEAISAILKISRFEGPSRALLFDKFSSDHITLFLNQLENHDKREFDLLDKKADRNHVVRLICIFLGVALIVFFTFTLRTNMSLFERLLIALITLGAGLLGGYGFGRSR